ncbi:DM13 domain-containing protein [Micromonospora sp. R77]|uniref:DM13 domain-containing protein n=1 Tax=Micromonospora sp. R77 TaxID=2925836 RepID=UPI001F6122FE|nr:DM13 domain-containing protein [Micromonospora sp. R77]MCI4062616.1 DM13 domain-containing protein [Micromonospora sp. R77]
MRDRLWRKPLTRVVVAVVGAGTAFGLFWFQPWKLVTDIEVHEQLTALGPASPGPLPSGTPAPAGPTLVGEGEFVGHEHDTMGSARLVRGVDGRFRLELVGLATSNGPDLHVWLTDQPVRTGPSGWKVFDDGRRVELGALKGNRGDQAYDLPAGTDVTGLTSVAIWCERFAVSFGAAPLDPTG